MQSYGASDAILQQFAHKPMNTVIVDAYRACEAAKCSVAGHQRPVVYLGEHEREAVRKGQGICVGIQTAAQSPSLPSDVPGPDVCRLYGETYRVPALQGFSLDYRSAFWWRLTTILGGCSRIVHPVGQICSGWFGSACQAATSGRQAGPLAIMFHGEKNSEAPITSSQRDTTHAKVESLRPDVAARARTESANSAWGTKA